VSEIALLTGEIQSGKTSLCLEVVAAAREAGIQLGGLVSPGVFQEREKIAIDVIDVRSGERRRLADGPGGRSTAISTRRWAFHPEAVAWGTQVLQEAVPCQLLVIDELGPLEFQRGEGWVSGFRAVASGDYTSALLVIRPSLLKEALNRWPAARIVNLDDPDEPLRKVQELFNHLRKEQ